MSLPTVVNWVKARRLKAHRTPGGHRRIAREDLASFMVLQGMPLPEELDGVVLARRKALVLGESGPLREGLARQLAHEGFAVEQASGGFAGGAAAARFEPDLVVLAASAPDGGEVLRGLRADRTLGEVAVLAVGPAGWVKSLKTAGCDAALSRPLAGGTLVRSAAELLGARPARQVDKP